MAGVDDLDSFLDDLLTYDKPKVATGVATGVAGRGAATGVAGRGQPMYATGVSTGVAGRGQPMYATGVSTGVAGRGQPMYGVPTGVAGRGGGAATGVATGVAGRGQPMYGAPAGVAGRGVATGVPTGVAGRGFSGTGGVVTGLGNYVAPPLAGRGGTGLGGVATHTPDGRAITVNSVICSHCKEAIVGRVTNAMGQTYHPEHFVCANCSQPFQDGRFVEHENKPYCEPHYFELFAPKCSRCKEPIKEGAVKAINKYWHEDHFTCQGCGKSLIGKSHKEAGGEPYCLECRKFAAVTIDPTIHICGRCKKPIIGEYIFLDGQYLHPEHFACAMCGKKLQNGDVHEHQGKNYCKEDYDKLQKSVCAGCDKPITGLSITALGRVWHIEHFCCTQCHEAFGGNQYYEHDGLPYCEEHFKQFFAKLCAKCNEPVIRDGIETLGKVWHDDCFQCQGCNCVLKLGGGVYSWQGKPMCKKCYLKLPTDVRKQIEKKQLGEQRAEKKRQEDARKEANKRNKEAKKHAKEARKFPG